MEKCIAHISSWMCKHKLKLNEDKTEAIIICSPKQLHKISVSSISVGGSDIEIQSEARNLGVTFDKHLNMKRHVTKTCRNMNFYLRQIGNIRKYLSQKATESLVHALITSRLDCNNVLLYYLPECDISRLLRTQNNAAKIVTLTSKYDHITPVLQKLHWLPVSFHIIFKKFSC